MTDAPLGLTARIVDRFLTSHLSIILLLASLVGGGIALLVTPREEDPQIVVPMADVLIQMPGASATEVENLVTINLEKKLWEIDGVEHVYSISRPGFALVTVRFFVGEDRTASLVKIYNKIQSNIDAVPSGVAGWVVKPVEISDVPILTLTLYSATATDADLRRVGDEILNRLQEVPNTAASTVVGGRRRQIRVQLDAERMAAHGVAPLDVVRVLRGADANLRVGEFARENREFVVDSGPFIESAQELANVVLAAPAGKPVSVRDVAEVIDGPEETTTYTRLRFGPAAGHLRQAAVEGPGTSVPAVTLAFAKRRGTNAVHVAEGLLRQVEELKRDVIPSDVQVLVTRDYGETANHKVNELVSSCSSPSPPSSCCWRMALGLREAFVVALAVPMTLAVTLLVDLLVGYTINRVTLFALILSLGLLVDDPIVDVENIYRHFRLRREPPLEATLIAVDEVRPPTILATFTVDRLVPADVLHHRDDGAVHAPDGVQRAGGDARVADRRLHGHAVGRLPPPAPASTTRRRRTTQQARAQWVRNVYRRIMSPLLDSRRRTWLFLGAVALAFVGSVLLAVVGLVPLKMLPFDNKNELQLVIDMPRGTTLEATDAVVRELGRLPRDRGRGDRLRVLRRHCLADGFQRHGAPLLPAPGPVGCRHPRQPAAEGCADAEESRHRPAHASRHRTDRRRTRREAQDRRDAAGPAGARHRRGGGLRPVGAAYDELIDAAKRVRTTFERTAGVVDVDDTRSRRSHASCYRLDREKAGLTASRSRSRADAGGRARGRAAGARCTSRRSVRHWKSSCACRARTLEPAELLALRVRGADGSLVPLGELGTAQETVDEQTIYHKNLRRFA